MPLRTSWVRPDRASSRSRAPRSSAALPSRRPSSATSVSTARTRASPPIAAATAWALARAFARTASAGSPSRTSAMSGGMTVNSTPRAVSNSRRLGDAEARIRWRGGILSSSVDCVIHAMTESTLGGFVASPPSQADLGLRREPGLDLALGRLVGVRAVDEVEGDLDREVPADRARRGLKRVRRPDHLAGRGDRLRALQHSGDQRPAGDELDKLAEERLVDVLGVVPVGDLFVGV